ncbi:MAG: recG [Chloroflexi bacterium]|nr:recG [Chloroflexota bacterium]
MAVNTGPLRKILDIENKRGYSDSAVFGGLDKFIRNWLPQLSAAMPDPVFLRRFSALYPPHPGYAQMNRVQRKEWSEAILTLLSELENRPTTNRKTRVIEPQPKIQNARVKKTIAGLQSLDTTVTIVKGISDILARKFSKLGVETVRDLLYFFPHRHLDYSQRAFINNLAIGQENTIIANVWEAREVRLGTRRSAEATVGDETGNVRIVWFNQPYLARTLKTGKKIVVSGRVTVFGGMPVFESPEWEPYEEKDLVHTGRLVPVYPLTEGLSQRQVRRIMKPAVDQWAWQLPDFLPASLRNRLKLLDLPEAILQAHYPGDENAKNDARRRLAFDELFLLQLGVLRKKRDWQEGQPGSPFKINQAELNTFLNSLPYRLTAAQGRVLNEIMADLQKTRPMSRLLQGEVGSGKTVVATAALVMAVAGGYQGALMAPTEILAEQHFETIRRVLSQVGKENGEGNIYTYSGFLNQPLTIGLLMGDLKQVKKQKVQERISCGEVDIAIGTHALIQKGVEFASLGLAVIDEQHRFGVEQRSILRQKGTNPHILVMTATPIPRTLALTLYGDLDLSVIDELPPGRQIIKTKWLKPEQRESAYNFLRQQIQNGRQAFIICPLVEESEVIQAKAAVAEYERLSRDVFPDLRLGLIHGRMPSEEKEAAMQKFNSGELDILVSTPVVEVGIDVPNATVMLIESADRFGLSQLHQFRGRVGRGKEQSYCMLLAERPSDIGRERLDLIEGIHNGFILAEEDLKLRGPGEFFGTRQSGLPDLKMARLSDLSLLELARNEATRLFQVDPALEKGEHQLLRVELARVWQHSSTEWS